MLSVNFLYMKRSEISVIEKCGICVWSPPLALRCVVVCCVLVLIIRLEDETIVCTSYYCTDYTDNTTVHCTHCSQAWKLVLTSGEAEISIGNTDHGNINYKYD